MIIHEPAFGKINTPIIEAHYSKKDGVSIKYVCTSEIRGNNKMVDIFYRETPHPQFGNKYFGLFTLYNHMDEKDDGTTMITNADELDGVEFGMIEDENGDYHYSAFRHDYKAVNGKVIDGGRAYTRGYGMEYFTLKDGEFVKNN